MRINTYGIFLHERVIVLQKKKNITVQCHEYRQLFFQTSQDSEKPDLLDELKSLKPPPPTH